MKDVPILILEVFSNQAKKDRKITSSASKGPWLITLDPISVNFALKYIEDSDIKKEIYVKYFYTKCNAAERDNTHTA